jgi:hypothetical protein
MPNWTWLAVAILGGPIAGVAFGRRWSANMNAAPGTSRWLVWAAMGMVVVGELALGAYVVVATRAGAITWGESCAFGWPEPCQLATTLGKLIVLFVVSVVLGFGLAMMTGWLLSEIRRLVLRRRARR